MAWRDYFGGTDVKAISITPPGPVDPLYLRPTNLDLPANLPPYWSPPAHAQVHWPDWPDEWRQVWFDQGFNYQRSSLVMAAVNWLGTQLCEAPPKLEEQQGEEWVPVTESEYLDLLAAPNPHHSGEDLFKDFALWWFCAGNVYWWKGRDKAGRLIALWPLESDCVRPVTVAGSGEFISYYEYTKEEERSPLAPRVIYPENMIHFRYALDPRDRRIGRSPLEAVILELAADQEAISYQAAFMKNFGVPPFVLSPTPDAAGTYRAKTEDLRQQYVDSQLGSRKGMPMFLNRPMQVTTVGISPDDMALDKARSLPEERVAGVLGIPGIVLQYGSFLDRSTYNNVATARRMAWDGCVIPTFRAISGTLRRSLIPEFYTDADNYWPGFDLSASPAMAEDMDMLYERYTKGYKEGWVKRSEARAGVNLPVDEALDDQYKAAPASPFAFGSAKGARADVETKQVILEEPWDYAEIAEYYRNLAPAEYSGLITARVSQ